MDERLEQWMDKLPGCVKPPFDISPDGLYRIGQLYKDFDPSNPQTLRSVFDSVVYNWTREPDGNIRPLRLDETIAARLHDTVMDRHVVDFLDPAKHITIGFMGGHNVVRTATSFSRVARMARELRRRGFMIVTGGGPGLMEAANFGAFMAPYNDDQFLQAIHLLRAAPTYGTDTRTAHIEKAEWLTAAVKVRELVLGDWSADEEEASYNMGIPTWFYGAEPPNLFATHVGKYFFNSLREDGLVSIANGGLIFGKGEAGTVQEVFQNLNYNYYREANVSATPMVFYDINFWDPNPITDAAAGAPLDDHRKAVFPLVRQLAIQAPRNFEQSLMLSNDGENIVEFISSKNADKLKKLRYADKRIASIQEGSQK